MKSLESEDYANDEKTLEKIIAGGVFVGLVGMTAGNFLDNEPLKELSYGFLSANVVMSVFYQFKDFKKKIMKDYKQFSLK